MKRWIHASTNVADHMIGDQTLSSLTAYALDYINDTDFHHMYNTPESFGRAAIRYIERETDVELSPDERAYVMEKASHGDFDAFDEFY